eukprot:gb/GEZN01010801.1/.p1 GENE.gb/GEZN01010801.1/~~gb/GEZN01010801.1/.p1  ORF type:complete len:150 (-),score=15.64 gb/GEZN01010801.1/:657-1106(-)
MALLKCIFVILTVGLASASLLLDDASSFDASINANESIIEVVGYVVDMYCWQTEGHKAIDTGSPLDTMPELHTTYCMRVPMCSESGFAVLKQNPDDDSYSILYEFDDDGDDVFRRWLNITNREFGGLFIIIGTEFGTELKVTHVSEVEE